MDIEKIPTNELIAELNRRQVQYREMDNGELLKGDYDKIFTCGRYKITKVIEYHTRAPMVGEIYYGFIDYNGMLVVDDEYLRGCWYKVKHKKISDPLSYKEYLQSVDIKKIRIADQPYYHKMCKKYKINE